MENYKGKYVDEQTFELSEIETLVPNKIVQNLKKFIDELGDDFMATSAMINREELSVVFGIIEKKNHLKYKVEVSLYKNKTIFMDAQKQCTGRDEMYTKWYDCARCDNGNVMYQDNFCSKCGCKFEWSGDF